MKESLHCDDCDKDYSSAGFLARHRREKHGEAAESNRGGASDDRDSADECYGCEAAAVLLIGPEGAKIPSCLEHFSWIAVNVSWVA